MKHVTLLSLMLLLLVPTTLASWENANLNQGHRLQGNITLQYTNSRSVSLDFKYETQNEIIGEQLASKIQNTREHIIFLPTKNSTHTYVTMINPNVYNKGFSEISTINLQKKHVQDSTNESIKQQSWQAFQPSIITKDSKKHLIVPTLTTTGTRAIIKQYTLSQNLTESFTGFGDGWEQYNQTRTWNISVSSPQVSSITCSGETCLYQGDDGTACEFFTNDTNTVTCIELTQGNIINLTGTQQNKLFEPLITRSAYVFKHFSSNETTRASSANAKITNNDNFQDYSTGSAPPTTNYTSVDTTGHTVEDEFDALENTVRVFKHNNAIGSTSQTELNLTTYGITDLNSFVNFSIVTNCFRDDLSPSSYVQSCAVGITQGTTRQYVAELRVDSSSTNGIFKLWVGNTVVDSTTLTSFDALTTYKINISRFGNTIRATYTDEYGDISLQDFDSTQYQLEHIAMQTFGNASVSGFNVTITTVGTTATSSETQEAKLSVYNHAMSLLNTQVLGTEVYSATQPLYKQIVGDDEYIIIGASEICRAGECEDSSKEFTKATLWMFDGTGEFLDSKSSVVKSNCHTNITVNDAKRHVRLGKLHLAKNPVPIFSSVHDNVCLHIQNVPKVIVGYKSGTTTPFQTSPSCGIDKDNEKGVMCYDITYGSLGSAFERPELLSPDFRFLWQPVLQNPSFFASGLGSNAIIKNISSNGAFIQPLLFNGLPTSNNAGTSFIAKNESSLASAIGLDRDPLISHWAWERGTFVQPFSALSFPSSQQCELTAVNRVWGIDNPSFLPLRDNNCDDAFLLSENSKLQLTSTNTIMVPNHQNQTTIITQYENYNATPGTNPLRLLMFTAYDTAITKPSISSTSINGAGILCTNQSFTLTTNITGHSSTSARGVIISNNGNGTCTQPNFVPNEDNTTSITSTCVFGGGVNTISFTPANYFEAEESPTQIMTFDATSTDCILPGNGTTTGNTTTGNSKPNQPSFSSDTGTPICLNQPVTFQTTTYKNLESSDRIRAVADCNGVINYGGWVRSGQRASVSCTFQTTGLKPIKLYVQDNAHPQSLENPVVLSYIAQSFGCYPSGEGGTNQYLSNEKDLRNDLIDMEESLGFLSFSSKLLIYAVLLIISIALLAFYMPQAGGSVYALDFVMITILALYMGWLPAWLVGAAGILLTLTIPFLVKKFFGGDTNG